MRRVFSLLSVSLIAFGALAIPLQERQDGDGDPLGALGSIISSALEPDPTPDPPTPPAPAAATTDLLQPVAATETSTKHHKTKSDSVTVGDAVTASSTSSETSAPTTSSITITSTSSSISSSSTSPTTILSTATVIPTPAATPNAASTDSSKASRSSISPGGIAAAVILVTAVLGTAFFLIWRFYGPVRRWREKREYEKMQERTYRPALDGFAGGKEGEKGLGLSNVEQERPFSFLAVVKPKSHEIKRKTIGSGPRGLAGARKSPLISESTSTRSSGIDKGLPSLPPGS